MVTIYAWRLENTPYYQCTQIRVWVIFLGPPSRLTKQISQHKLHQIPCI